MENTKAKLTYKKNICYAVIAQKDEFGIEHKKWINLGVKKDEKMTKIAQKMCEKLADFDKKNAEKALKIAQKMANKRVNSHISFIKFAEFWLKQKRKNIEINTYDDYVYELKNVKDYFSNELKIKDIKSTDVDGFYAYLYSKGVSNNTILHYHVLLNQIFNFAIKIDVLNFNIMQKVEKPKKEKYEHRFYTPRQLQELIEYLQKENSFLKVPVILTAIYGLRRSEIVGLLWNSVDFENKKIYINHKVVETNKNGKAIMYRSNKMKNESSKRVLPLIASAEKVLIDAKIEIQNNIFVLKKDYVIKDASYVCVDKKGKLISPHRLTVSFSKFLKEHNLPKIRFHDLRHSCASMLVANGVNMKAVQEWLGHSNYGTTANTYSHLDFSAKEKSGQKIEEIIYCKSQSEIQNKYNLIDDNTKMLFEMILKKIEELQNSINKLVC